MGSFWQLGQNGLNGCQRIGPLPVLPQRMAMGCAGWALSSSSSSSRGLLPLLSRRCSIPLFAASHCRLRLSSSGHPSFSAAWLESSLRVVHCAQAKSGFASFREHEIASRMYPSFLIAIRLRLLCALLEFVMIYCLVIVHPLP